MMWLIAGLLLLIAFLLWVVTIQLQKGLTLITELIRASGQANIRELAEIAKRIDDFAGREGGAD